MDHKSVCPHVQSWRIQFITHASAYFHFHLFDLQWGVSVISGFGKISWTQSFKFLKFCGNEHWGSTNKLKLRFGKVIGFLEVFISKRDGNVISFSFESKLITDMNHPVHENSTHEPIEVFLPALNVIGLNQIIFLSVF